jgi:hypothetical protein
VVHTYNGILFSSKEEWIMLKENDGTGDYQVEWKMPSSERQILHIFIYIQNLDLKTMTWLY